MVDSLRRADVRDATQAVAETAEAGTSRAGSSPNGATSYGSRAGADLLDAWIARAAGAPTFPAELFAKTSCPPPAEQVQDLRRIATPPRVNAAELLVRSGVSLREALASAHEQSVEAFERFISDYIAAAAAT